MATSRIAGMSREDSVGQENSALWAFFTQSANSLQSDMIKCLSLSVSSFYFHSQMCDKCLNIRFPPYWITANTSLSKVSRQPIPKVAKGSWRRFLPRMPQLWCPPFSEAGGKRRRHHLVWSEFSFFSRTNVSNMWETGALVRIFFVLETMWYGGESDLRKQPPFVRWGLVRVVARSNLPREDGR